MNAIAREAAAPGTIGGSMPITAGATNASAAAWRTILLAGCAGASVDLIFAFVFFGATLGITPLRVMQSVASGLYGRASFGGGLPTALVGFVAHYFILIVAAWWYWLASRRLPALNRRWAGSGAAFGVAIYVVMQYIVVPLSAAPRGKPALINVIGQFLIHPVIGLAIAYIVSRAARREAPSAPESGAARARRA